MILPVTWSMEIARVQRFHCSHTMIMMDGKTVIVRLFAALFE
jgi:hypothetical protein